MTERDTGSVLRLFPLGEHGAVICWCTANHGMIRTAARNLLKPGSELSGVIDLFHECELVFRTSNKSDLCTLASADLVTPRLGLRAQLTRLRLAGYMAQLLMNTVESGAGESQWHDLISGALDYAASAALRVEIMLHFEKRLAELHGLYPAESPVSSVMHCCAISRAFLRGEATCCARCVGSFQVRWGRRSSPSRSLFV